MPQSASLIFCPNAGNGFEDISRIRKAGIQMNTKMSNHEIMVKEKKLNESWRQSKRQQQPIKRRCPVMKAHIVPRPTRRGC
jgi:hypothetical protein